MTSMRESQENTNAGLTSANKHLDNTQRQKQNFLEGLPSNMMEYHSSQTWRWRDGLGLISS